MPFKRQGLKGMSVCRFKKLEFPDFVPETAVHANPKLTKHSYIKHMGLTTSSRDTHSLTATETMSAVGASSVAHEALGPSQRSHHQASLLHTSSSSSI